MLGSRIGLTLSVVGCLQGLVVTNEIVPVLGCGGFNLLSCDPSLPMGATGGGGAGGGATAVPHHDTSYLGMLMARGQQSVEASRSQAAKGIFSQLQRLAYIADIAIKLRPYEKAVEIPTEFKSEKLVLQGGAAAGPETKYPVAEYFRRYQEAENLFFEKCLSIWALQQDRKDVQSAFLRTDQRSMYNSLSAPLWNPVAEQRRYNERNPTDLSTLDQDRVIPKLQKEVQWLQEHASGFEFKYITLFGSDPKVVSTPGLMLADCHGQVYESKCAAKCCPASGPAMEGSGIPEVVADSEPAPLCPRASPRRGGPAASAPAGPCSRRHSSSSPRHDGRTKPAAQAMSPRAGASRFRAPSSAGTSPRSTSAAGTSPRSTSAASEISTAASLGVRRGKNHGIVERQQSQPDLDYDEY